MNKKIVITGIGVVSSIGIGKEDYWNSLREAKSGIDSISLFDVADYKVKVAGEVKNFNPENYSFSKRELINLDRATLMLLVATTQALQDGELVISNETTCDIGVSVGTTFGSLQSLSNFDKESVLKGPQLVNPSKFPNTVANLPASQISIYNKIKGFNATISTGMSAGIDAIDYAIKHISLYDKKSVIVSAVEEMCEQTFLGLHSLGCLSGMSAGTPLSCPFGQSRDGVVFGEGAGTIIVEGYEDAKNRNTKIYAEILGVASNFDPSRFNRYNKQGTGMVECMNLALKQCGLEADDIDLVIANANSSKDADEIEARAITEVFGEKNDSVFVTSIKGMLGETYSAAGILTVIAAIASFEKNFIFPIINVNKKDPKIKLNLILNKAKSKKIKTVMMNAFAPNGINSVIIVKKIHDK